MVLSAWASSFPPESPREVNHEQTKAGHLENIHQGPRPEGVQVSKTRDLTVAQEVETRWTGQSHFRRRCSELWVRAGWMVVDGHKQKDLNRNEYSHAIGIYF